MKIDKNEPAYPNTIMNSHNQNSCGMGIPLRLEIATRIYPHLAGDLIFEDAIAFALKTADALIKAHNETCWGES